MKKSLMGVLWLLAAAGVAVAQEENTQAVRTNAAASFELTSAAKVDLLHQVPDAVRRSGGWD